MVLVTKEIVFTKRTHVWTLENHQYVRADEISEHTSHNTSLGITNQPHMSFCHVTYARSDPSNFRLLLATRHAKNTKKSHFFQLWELIFHPEVVPRPSDSTNLLYTIVQQVLKVSAPKLKYFTTFFDFLPQKSLPKKWHLANIWEKNISWNKCATKL